MLYIQQHNRRGLKVHAPESTDARGTGGAHPQLTTPRQDRKAFGHGLLLFFHSHRVRSSETKHSRLAVKWGWKSFIPPRNMRLGWALTHCLAWCKHLAVAVRIVSCLCSWERRGTCGRGSVFCTGSLIRQRVREKNRTARPRGDSAPSPCRASCFLPSELSGAKLVTLLTSVSATRTLFFLQVAWGCLEEYWERDCAILPSSGSGRCFQMEPRWEAGGGLLEDELPWEKMGIALESGDSSSLPLPEGLLHFCLLVPSPSSSPLGLYF